MPENQNVDSFIDLLTDEAKELLNTSGTELIKKIGINATKTVVLDVLSGRNLRDSTEMLTRRRLASLNAATIAMMLRGLSVQSDFVEKLPEIAERILRKKRLSKSERWMAQWIVGLTDKASKSVYGKLFERLVLGSLLHILGLRYTGTQSAENFEREFWLSSQGERRESDATALWEAGKGVRFDIGFIGRGNPEISLDKVSRFQREIELGRSTWYLATIIIVDRIGKGSRIKRLARRVEGDIVQMSLAYWPQEVAQILNQRMGFEHPLVNMDRSQIRDFLSQQMQEVPLEDFLPN